MRIAQGREQRPDPLQAVLLTEDVETLDVPLSGLRRQRDALLPLERLELSPKGLQLGDVPRRLLALGIDELCRRA